MHPIIVLSLFGLAYGVVLQRSGFCFARAAFELFLLRSRDAVAGVATGLLVGTVGFAGVTLLRARAGLPATGHLLVLPVGWGTVVGGLLFGTGMSLAGMCASGMLQRLGQGYVLALVVLVGMLAGAALNPLPLLPAGLLRPWTSQVWLGDWLGPGPAFLLSAAVLALAWLWVGRPARGLPSAPGPAPPSPLHPLAGPVVGGALLGALNTAQMAAMSPWTVGYPLALVPTLVAGRAAESSLHAALPLLALNACIALGAMAAASSRGLRVRLPRTGAEAARGLVGGALMGMGIELAHGCNIGGLFSALPSLSASAWLYLPSVLAGSWFGTRVLANLERRGAPRRHCSGRR